MHSTIKQTNNAIKAVRKEMLKALENASNKVLAIYPQAESDPETARLVFNIIGSQAHESLDLFLRQFAQGLDASLGDAWLKKAEAEIERLDREIEETQALLSSDEVAADYEKVLELTAKLEQLQTEQEAQYEIWELLAD